MQDSTQRVAAIHDLSGYGKASLTIVIPTLSAMGIQVCPLPTAILSTHTEFEDFTFLDLTDEMQKIIAHWRTLDLQFDAIYSGFLGSPEQVEIVAGFIRDFQREKQLVVVDPVMADDGKLYPTMDQKMVEKMRWLVSLADIITPNLTELAFLANGSYKENAKEKEIRDWIRKISDGGPRFVVVTSMPTEKSAVGAIGAFDRERDEIWRIEHERLPASFSGTGDTFTSVLLGSLLQGNNLSVSVERAMRFVYSTIALTDDLKEKEISLEKLLISGVV